MPLDAADAMLVGRLQQSVETLSKTVDGLIHAVNEFRAGVDEERRAMDRRIADLESRHERDEARAAGMSAGFTAGQKATLALVVLTGLYGVKSGAVDLWAVLSKALGK